MAHMQVISTFDTMSLVVDGYWIPSEYVRADDEVESKSTGWFAHLSANGYLDHTPWQGPYATEAEAVKAVCDLYECDEKGDGK